MNCELKITVLGYKNTCKALTDHVETEDKVVTFCYSLGGKQKTTFTSESSLYSLIRIGLCKRFALASATLRIGLCNASH